MGKELNDFVNPQTVDDWVNRVRALRQDLLSGPLHYDGNAPSFVSNVATYSTDHRSLRRYEMQLYAATRMKTFSLAELFLAGIERNIIYALPLASRAQIEIFLVVWDVARVIAENEGINEQTFVQRVETVDRVLINAVYGARNDFLPKLLRHYGTGMLGREILRSDVDALSATNILSRLKRLQNDSRYSQLAESYEILCELAHPNLLQNFLLTTYEEKRPKILRWAYDSAALSKAIAFTAEPMVLASEGAMDLINRLQAPFGTGPMVSSELL